MLKMIYDILCKALDIFQYSAIIYHFFSKYFLVPPPSPCPSSGMVKEQANSVSIFVECNLNNFY